MGVCALCLTLTLVDSIDGLRHSVMSTFNQPLRLSLDDGTCLGLSVLFFVESTDEGRERDYIVRQW